MKDKKFQITVNVVLLVNFNLFLSDQRNMPGAKQEIICLSQENMFKVKNDTKSRTTRSRSLSH